MELDSNERAQIRLDLGNENGYEVINDLENVSNKQDLLNYDIRLRQQAVIEYEEGFSDGTYGY